MRRGCTSGSEAACRRSCLRHAGAPGRARALSERARLHPRAVQVLRSKVSNGDEVLLKMDLAAGHFSAADRYRYLRELAFDYAWLLDLHGRASATGDEAAPPLASKL